MIPCNKTDDSTFTCFVVRLDSRSSRSLLVAVDADAGRQAYSAGRRCLVRHMASTVATPQTRPDTDGNFGSLFRRSEDYIRGLVCPAAAVYRTSPTTACALPVFSAADESARLVDYLQT